jgi:hypothetical protein
MFIRDKSASIERFLFLKAKGNEKAFRRAAIVFKIGKTKPQMVQSAHISAIGQTINLN